MYTGFLDQNWTRNLSKSIVYPIGPQSKLYEDNQATIKITLADRFTQKSIPLNVLIAAIHELHLRKIFDMVDTRSNM